MSNASSIIYGFAKADTKKKEVLTFYKFEQTVRCLNAYMGQIQAIFKHWFILVGLWLHSVNPKWWTIQGKNDLSVYITINLILVNVLLGMKNYIVSVVKEENPK